MVPPWKPLWVFRLNKPSLQSTGSRLPGQPLGLDSRGADHTDPRGPATLGLAPRAEVDEPVTEQAGGLLLVVGEIGIFLILPGGLVTAV